MTWNPARWLVSHATDDSSFPWESVSINQLVADDDVFHHFQEMMKQPKDIIHLKRIACLMQELWDDIDWKNQAVDLDEMLWRQRALELWTALWRNESCLISSSPQSACPGKFYQRLRCQLESQWNWNIWITRYLHMARDSSLWHEGACDYLFRRVQSSGAHRPYALTLLWKILFSRHAPSRHYPVSHTARNYVQNLPLHLSWATLSDYYVKRFIDWEKKYSRN